jgi:hypothetical protein|tara:strand:- start:237 stop:536 length:300 start_codon:yes stop_codon:yes gene_type:complete
MPNRTVPNKCFQTRIEIEGTAYRAISFFHEHPSQIPEEQWTLFRHNGHQYIVDKLTLSVMAEHECHLLTREVDQESPEPTIVSVSMASIGLTKQIDSIK